MKNGGNSYIVAQLTWRNSDLMLEIGTNVQKVCNFCSYEWICRQRGGWWPGDAAFCSGFSRGSIKIHLGDLEILMQCTTGWLAVKFSLVYCVGFSTGHHEQACSYRMFPACLL